MILEQQISIRLRHEQDYISHVDRHLKGSIPDVFLKCHGGFHFLEHLRVRREERGDKEFHACQKD